MPEPLVITISLLGIVLLGVAFSSIDLLGKVGQFIGLALFVVIGILLLNRSMPALNNWTRGFNNDFNQPGYSLTDRIGDGVSGIVGGVQDLFQGADARAGWQQLPFDVPFLVSPRQAQFLPNPPQTGLQPLRPDQPTAQQPPITQSPPAQQPGAAPPQVINQVPDRVGRVVQPGAPAAPTVPAPRGTAPAGSGGRPVSAWW